MNGSRINPVSKSQCFLLWQERFTLNQLKNCDTDGSRQPVLASSETKLLDDNLTLRSPRNCYCVDGVSRSNSVVIPWLGANYNQQEIAGASRVP